MDQAQSALPVGFSLGLLVALVAVLGSVVILWMLVRSVAAGRGSADALYRRARWPLRLTVMVASIAILVAGVSATVAPSRETPVQPQATASAEGRWSLVWSDEFDGDDGAAPDPDSWTAETGGGGWGNDELQYYTSSTDNAALDGEGHLVLTAREVDQATSDLECWYGPCAFTSARLVTAQKQEFTYGRFETRVKVPWGGGLWPALWMLGSDPQGVGWPETGEIDVMEFVGHTPDAIFGTIHGPGYSGGSAYGGSYDLGTPASDDWHDFTVEWSPENIIWSVDGIVYHEADPADVAPDEWVFDHPFFLVTNMAVGGNFGGAVADDVGFPKEFTIDHVRVYRDTTAPG
jgi:beta-glucanase (GH16 family)